jgi:hypothetical protein
MVSRVAPTADFVFDGDTFAVPSWEFRCELPPVVLSPFVIDPPTTRVGLFGVEWTVYRGYETWTRETGVVFVAPNTEGVGLNSVGRGATFAGTRRIGDQEVAVMAHEKRDLTPDAFMHALKAIAERNAE